MHVVHLNRQQATGVLNVLQRTCSSHKSSHARVHVSLLSARTQQTATPNVLPVMQLARLLIGKCNTSEQIRLYCFHHIGTRLLVIWLFPKYACGGDQGYLSDTFTEVKARRLVLGWVTARQN